MKPDIATLQSRPTAPDLAVVLALVRGGTLADAARRNGSDPSTVFRALQRLEKATGQRLFERTRHGYLPTEAATELARHAERIEVELEAAHRALDGGAPQVVGRVRLTTTDSVLRGLVLPVLAPLTDEHPGLQLELLVGNQIMSLSRRDADLALRAAPRPADHLIGRELGRIRFAVMGLRGQRRRPLDSLQWIAPDEAMPEHPTVRWRRKQLPKVVPRHLVEGIVGVADAVLAGLGVGALPLFMLEAEPRLKPVSEVLEGCESTLWLLAHPESRHLPRISAVYQHLTEAIRLPR